jgi:crotonobetainyl-CoA:carnitine CoA-transferase CaiB-like acyl-CoA transferase
MVIETEHPVAGRVSSIGLPVKFHATPGGGLRAAPLYGQHTREVLAEAGYTSAEIERLIAAGAAIAGPVTGRG